MVRVRQLDPLVVRGERAAQLAALRRSVLGQPLRARPLLLRVPLSLSRTPLARVAARVRGRDRVQLGAARELEPDHRPLPNRDHLARLLRRLDPQLDVRRSLRVARLRGGIVPPSAPQVLARVDRDRRALRARAGLHDPRQPRDQRHHARASDRRDPRVAVGRLTARRRIADPVSSVT